jgi:hypothetical protein
MKIKYFGFFLIASLCTSSAFANDSDAEGCRNVNTMAGRLVILDINMQADGLYNELKLNGASFDKLYGFAGSCDKHTLNNGLVDRMLVYDFNNGGSNPPTISLYDFRATPPVALQIGSEFLVGGIKWPKDRGVLLKLDGGKYKGRWYEFDDEKLIPIPVQK